MTGERTAEVGGPPTARTVSGGDLLLVDLVPRLGAYWADSCATVALGEPPEAARAAHAAALDALEAAKAAIRPGVTAGAVTRPPVRRWRRRAATRITPATAWG